MLTAVLLILAGLLFQQYLAPSVRQQLFNSGQMANPPTLAFTSLDPIDLETTPQAIGMIAQPEVYSGSASFFPVLQSGRPAVLTVSLIDDKQRQISGALGGGLSRDRDVPQRAANQQAAQPAGDSGTGDPMAGHQHHMTAPAGADALRLSFRQPQPSLYQATVLPLREGDYELALHLQSDNLHLMLKGSGPVAVRGDPQNHSAHVMPAPSGFFKPAWFASAALK